MATRAQPPTRPHRVRSPTRPRPRPTLPAPHRLRRHCGGRQRHLSRPAKPGGASPPPAPGAPPATPSPSTRTWKTRPATRPSASSTATSPSPQTTPTRRPRPPSPSTALEPPPEAGISACLCFQQSAHGVESRGKRTVRIDPGGSGAALSKRLDGLDKRADVVWPDKLVGRLHAPADLGCWPVRRDDQRARRHRGPARTRRTVRRGARPTAPRSSMNACFGEVLPYDEVESSA